MADPQPTKVQQRILDLIDEGMGATDIAKATKTRPNTIHNHVRRMKERGILPKEFSLRGNATNGAQASAQAAPTPPVANGRSGLGPAGLDTLKQATETYKQVAIETYKTAEERRKEIDSEIAAYKVSIEELQAEDADLQGVMAAATNVEEGVGAITL